MKRIYFFLVFVVVTTQLFAQEHNLSRAKNALFLDVEYIYITGNYAINYERQVYANHGFKSGINLGFGGWYSFVNKGNVSLNHQANSYSIPVTINTVTGSGSNHFELDLGVRYLLNKKWTGSFDNGIESPIPQLDNSVFLPVCTFGYRYQKSKGGVVFRAFVGSGGIGLGLGHAF